ncbi:MAG: glutamate--tRNA ligase [Patescibacteria group bacterium]|nr:glutamate--tRNA ligase [Patescibacteria group bacterium]MDD4304390.1 glutamate--tRNA ligase [Patescibacteria group bacterium]MDD4695413.1 glutamate--tRNA ligase [Patescibacteria group bacterium]
MNYKTRFAPSPTGYLHIGGLRTALYNYLFIKKYGGKMILRIEDTDRERYIANADKQIIDTLKTFGINFDIGPYYQSERLDLYKKFVQQLISEDKAYYCFCSKERLEKLREEQQKNKQIPKYDRHCTSLSKKEIQEKLNNNESFVIRLKLPENEDVVFEDEVYGQVKINTKDLDDQVLLKSDGYPTYHLAVVIDDHDMGISHIIRGEEWLPSTPKHIILYKMFSWEIPKFIHLPLLLNPDRSKLSKRQGDVAAEDFLKKGYLPEAIINYIAFLGWNPKTTKEIYSMDELIQDFSVDKINKAGAVFDVDKLNWINAEYIKNIVKEKGEKYKEIIKILPNYIKETTNEKMLEKIFIVLSSRLNYFEQLKEDSQFFFNLQNYNADHLIFKKSNKELTIKGLKIVKESLESLNDELIEEQINTLLNKVMTQNNLNPGDIFWPLRFALSGLEKSPSPAEILWILGKDESLKRINLAIEKLEK